LIALDTNLLVYAHRRDSSWYEAASDRVRDLAEGRSPWAIPWPCIHEFYAVVTHPRIYDPPSDRARAIDQIEAWLESPSLVMLAESEPYWPAMKEQLETSQITGPQVHDARVAALCRMHGVRELWTADRDFSRYPGLKTRNPLV
jgi:toxin-antitoxin system PIN domain toxin